MLKVHNSIAEVPYQHLCNITVLLLVLLLVMVSFDIYVKNKRSDIFNPRNLLGNTELLMQPEG
jgi:hypothetical protein